MAPKKKQRKTAAPAPAAAPAVAARKEWEAEKLTGKRAQKGGKNGTVVYTYEVQWKTGPGGKNWSNTFEPPECLVGWEPQMKEVDAQVIARAQQSFLKPIQVKRAVQEQQAREKAEELRLKRDRLLRKQRRLARAQFSEGEEEDDEEEDDDSDYDQLLARRRRSPSVCRPASGEYEQVPNGPGVAPASNGGATLTAPGRRHLSAPPVDGSGKPGALSPARRRRSPSVCRPASSEYEHLLIELFVL
jgi:hypothetical protein